MSSHQLNRKDADKLKYKASIASISVSGMLTILKLFASLYSGSLAVLSSMIDSLSDILASAITFIAVKISAKPATDIHRYGYGKIEAISALMQAAFIAGSGLFVMYDAITRIFQPKIIEQTGWALLIMTISLICTLILIGYQKHVAKLTNSQAINADSEHYVVDVLTNISIIISLVAVKIFEINWIDTLTAFGVAIYLLINAYKLAKDAIDVLLDKELDSDIRHNVKNIIKSHSFVKGVHDLRTRNLGNEYMFELHLELDGNLSLYDAHDLSEMIENDINETYPNAQVIIHQDPAGIKEKRLDTQLIRTKKTKK